MDPHKPDNKRKDILYQIHVWAVIGVVVDVNPLISDAMLAEVKYFTVGRVEGDLLNHWWRSWRVSAVPQVLHSNI
jgi:hypothetical protein